ncbi:FAD-binding oxidoreductase [Flavimaricola marinus]|uniref:Putative FAD-linked oxidoreductase n=1 Tax=Flavimaricola marinus TaxID=1819565 RepID=A0A238LJG8_9RHOB|nr:FAD-binding oxidoreductase [Flavimaricola marinus]SMY09811.1 putative FAD-linked oxidoreductase [Flavimaricola marinus]
MTGTPARPPAPPGVACLTAPGDMAPYLAGVRGEKGQALAVLRPQTTEAVAACVRHCHAEGMNFVPQSGNTGLVGASVPGTQEGGVVLSLDRLRGECTVDAANRTVSVSAGLRLSELNAQLAPHGLFFPIDLGADPMIGGMIATNTGGGRYLRYGDVRRHVLGLTVVLNTAKAEVLTLGGAVRKANTGPDWRQMFIGTSGWFGVVTRAVLNVEPMVQAQAAALVVPSSHAAMLDLLRHLEIRLGPLLSAFEFMSCAAMRHTFTHVPAIANPFARGAIPQMALLIEVSRTTADAPWDTPLDEVLQAAFAEAWDLPGAPVEDALFGRAEEIWALRHALSEGVRTAGPLIAFDLGFTRDKVIAFREQMHRTLPARYPMMEICDFGHLGDGGLHFNLIKTDGPAQPSFEEGLRDWVVEQAVEGFGASFSAEHGLGPKNLRYFERYTALDPQVLRRMCGVIAANGC